MREEYDADRLDVGGGRHRPRPHRAPGDLARRSSCSSPSRRWRRPRAPTSRCWARRSASASSSTRRWCGRCWCPRGGQPVRALELVAAGWRPACCASSRRRSARPRSGAAGAAPERRPWTPRARGGCSRAGATSSRLAPPPGPTSATGRAGVRQPAGGSSASRGRPRHGRPAVGAACRRGSSRWTPTPAPRARVTNSRVSRQALGRLPWRDQAAARARATASAAWPTGRPSRSTTQAARMPTGSARPPGRPSR